MKTISTFAASSAMAIALSLSAPDTLAQAAAPPAPAAAPARGAPAPVPAAAPAAAPSPGVATPPPAPAAAPAGPAAPSPEAPVAKAPVQATLKQRAIELQQRRIRVLNQSIAEQQARVKAKAPEAAPAADPATEAAKAAIAQDEAKRSAAQTTVSVLEGAKVSPASVEKALAVEKAELAELRAKDPQGADTQASEASADALGEAAKATPAAAQVSPNKTVQEVEFQKGDLLHYGPTVSLLRVSALRNPGEPGRYRNYEGRYEFVPAEFGFQFLFAPHNNPWRYQLANGKKFQLLSAGGMLLARIDKDDVQRGNLSVAATLSFFQEIIGLGVGVDLYRGVPIQGANGASGGDTAFTGLLAWSLMRRGEVTPENVFFVVSLGLEPLVRSVTGEL